MIDMSEQRRTLACMEVWGGNKSVIRTVQLPDLTAWVYSNPAGSDEGGGDVHFLSVCGQSVLSRVVLADVSGHGAEVSASAEMLHALMRNHINTWDQREFVRGLNKSFRGPAAGGKYATAAILGILRDSEQTAFTNAGHLPPLWRRAKNGTWAWLDEKTCERECGVEGLPVGLIPGTNYRQTLIQLDPGDILLLYTDGITEAQDASGEMLGRDRWMQWVRSAPAHSPAAAGRFLVNRLGEFRKDNIVDDETIIVIQRGSLS